MVSVYTGIKLTVSVYTGHKLMVSVSRAHYTGTYTSKEAKASGKPLWSSEDFSSEANEYGAACMARVRCLRQS